jgi:hypothetical protein
LLKAVCAGIGALLVLAAAFAGYVAWTMRAELLSLSDNGGGTYVGATVWHARPIAALAIAVFAAGFVWQYRRSK